MQDRIYGWYSFVALPPVLALLFAGYLLCTVGFSQRGKALGLEHEIPDAQGWYSRDRLRDLLDQLGPDGRRCYALSECTLDVAFPLIYASLFAGLFPHLYPRTPARWLLALPLAALATDLSENFHFAYLAYTFDQFDTHIASWYWTAVLSTATKFVCFALAILALIVGGIGRLYNWWTAALEGPDSARSSS